MTTEINVYDIQSTYEQRESVYFEKRYDEPKFVFKTVGEKIHDRLAHTGDGRLLDVGGATGEFVYYLNQIYPNIKTVCLEYSQELIDRGKNHVPNSEFIQGDANHMPMVADGAYHVTTMLGVIAIFDDFKPSLNECLRVTKTDGLVVLHSVLNEYPIDALIRWRYSGESGPYNTGRNIFSIKSISNFLDTHKKVKNYRFEKFRLPFDLAPRPDDLNRSWTELDPSSDRIIRNGLMELNEQIVTIHT